ncbi:MAG: hypothetical protein P0Y48_01410 [Candidatus Microbacterium phytovorans]|uniref:Uncharacterized protein n=1 Tax=Candidatus Microbacterium phytovorans TaxID=3121374 RepID=A0AAJ5W264_9MICO|nr:hypothetical protein [Microbacterium sp.]WEK13898.1 MAG: hypothetical protein P0Y48_01410 [Microbacterium sp.]
MTDANEPADEGTEDENDTPEYNLGDPDAPKRDYGDDTTNRIARLTIDELDEILKDEDHPDHEPAKRFAALLMAPVRRSVERLLETSVEPVNKMLREIAKPYDEQFSKILEAMKGTSSVSGFKPPKIGGGVTPPPTPPPASLTTASVTSAIAARSREIDDAAFDLMKRQIEVMTEALEHSKQIAEEERTDRRAAETVARSAARGAWAAAIIAGVGVLVAAVGIAVTAVLSAPGVVDSGVPHVPSVSVTLAP